MITVNVTAEHIRRGERANCNKCPVALAIIDAMPDIDPDHEVLFESLAARVERRSNCELIAEYPLPAAAVQFIHDFDLYGMLNTIKPFSFTIEVLGVVEAL